MEYVNSLVAIGQKQMITFLFLTRHLDAVDVDAAHAAAAVDEEDEFAVNLPQV